jgi:hypothetical protein
MSDMEKNIAEIAAKFKTYQSENAADLSCWSIFDGLWADLQQSEALLILLMDGKEPSPSVPGDIELGPALYILNEHVSFLKSAPFCMPETTITSSMIASWDATLKGNGVVYNNGTLFSYDTYCQFDLGWYTVALVHYLQLKAGFLGITLYSPFPANPITVAVDSSNESLTIALAGDWGTGFYPDGNVDCPAQLVGNAIDGVGADYTIHLGDVYYAGTNNGKVPIIHTPIDGEEQKNFVDVWKAGSSGSFTMNSNHEMYDGANGLFDVALGDPGKALFSQQQGTSYFALTYENWVVIGLDSGYFDPSSMFMAGAIGNDDNTQQADFINTLDLDGKQIIVLTHHIGIEFDGSTVNNLNEAKYNAGLWDQVTTALGQGGAPRNPDFWYYGHVHNGVAYNADAPAVSGLTTPSGNAPMMRCNGHGSLPFGKGYALLQQDGSYIPGVDYMSYTPMPNPNSQQGNRVLNGFATIELSKNQIIETFYEVSATETTTPWTLTTNFDN